MTDRITELQEEIKSLKVEMDNFELDPDDFTDEYEDMLNECYGYFMGYNAAYILKNVDETAYRCGLIDFVDGKNKEDHPDYKEMEEELEELENELESLEEVDN